MKDRNIQNLDFVADSLVIVRNVDDLKTLSRSPLLYSRKPLTFRLPELSASEAEALSSRLNQARSECGCSLGAKCMIVGALATLAWLSARYGFLTAAFFWRLPWAFLCTVVSAGAGKAVGLLSARRHLHREIGLLLLNTPTYSQGELQCPEFGRQ
jgi:hypothetical protein